MSNFPAGLKVLVVDDDLSSLQHLQRLLKACHYQVTLCERATDALSLLRGNRYGIDIVLTDVYTPEMDGFQLLEIIRLEMDYLPVVVMSSQESKDAVMKAVDMGASDYLMKPLRQEEISVIWQHVVRKQKRDLHSLMLLSKMSHGSYNAEEYENGSTSPIENCGSSTQERRVEDLHEVHKNDLMTLKKPRMIWTPELHQQFVAAVSHIGLANVVPKKVLEHMKVAGLTRENVASHLQKYRLNLRRKKENKMKMDASIMRHYQDVHPRPVPVGHGQVYACQNQMPPQTSIVSQAEDIAIHSSPNHGCTYNQTFSESSMLDPIYNQKNFQAVQRTEGEPSFDEYTAYYAIPYPCTTVMEGKEDDETKLSGTYKCLPQETQQMEDDRNSDCMNYCPYGSNEHPFFYPTL